MASRIGFRDTGLVATDGTYTLTITPPTGLSADDTISFADLFTAGGGGVNSIIAGDGITTSGSTDITVTNNGVRTLSAGYGASVTGTNAATVSVALTQAQAALTGPVAMTNANQFYVGPSVSLAAGTWLVIGRATMTRATTTITQYTMRIGDGTTFYASAQMSHPSQNPHAVCLTAQAIITLGSTTTIRIEAAANQGAATMQNTPTVNGTGGTDNATMISAVRIS